MNDALEQQFIKTDCLDWEWIVILKVECFIPTSPRFRSQLVQVVNLFSWIFLDTFPETNKLAPENGWLKD